MESVAASVSKIAEFLQTLSSPTRLQILQALRHPKQLGDVCVPAKKGGPHISRQAVRRHLDILMQQGLIKRLPGPKKNRDVYFLDRGGVFLVADEIRQLTRIHPAQGHEGEEDLTRGTPVLEVPRGAPRPRLLTVYGPDDGAVYPLDDGEGCDWIIGRGTDSCIRIEHDPCLSYRHARLVGSQSSFFIQDLGSRNGTFLNFEPVGDEPVHWATGDIVTVGRTRLLLQA